MLRFCLIGTSWPHIASATLRRQKVVAQPVGPLGESTGAQAPKISVPTVMPFKAGAEPEVSVSSPAHEKSHRRNPRSSGL
jgi:hypothetical protein